MWTDFLTPYWYGFGMSCVGVGMLVGLVSSSSPGMVATAGVVLFWIGFAIMLFVGHPPA